MGELGARRPRPPQPGRCSPHIAFRGPVLAAASFRLTPAAVTAVQWLRARVALRDEQPLTGVA